MSAPAAPSLTAGDRQWLERYGPWALVTGASSGIGREFARQLARRGLNLVLVARQGDVLASLGQQLTAEYGVQVRPLVADLSDPAAVDFVVSRAAELEVGLLVASAGFGTSGPFLASGLEHELNMVDVNCRAVVTLTHQLGRRFAQRGRGGVVLLSSLVAFQGVPRAASYAATKAFVQSLAEALRIEWKPLGIDVIACAPGPVASGFAQRANMRMNMAATPEQVAQATLKALGRQTTVRPGWLSKLLEWSLAPLPRWGRVRIMSLVMGGMTAHQHGETKSPARGLA